MDQRLTRLAVAVNWQNLALGHEVRRIKGATCVRNRALPRIHDANFVFDIDASEAGQIDRLLAQAEEEYQHAAMLTIRTGPFTPPAFEARLARGEFDCREAKVLVLDGPPNGTARPYEMRPIADESTWLRYRELKYLDWQEYAAHAAAIPGDVAIADGFVAACRLKCPPVQYFLAVADGQAVGHCSAWHGLDGVGQLEDLFVHAAYRHQGIATAMIHHGLAVARAGGAGPVVIVVDPMNSAAKMYERLGWRLSATCRQYGRPMAARERS